MSRSCIGHNLNVVHPIRRMMNICYDFSEGLSDMFLQSIGRGRCTQGLNATANTSVN